QWRTWQSPFLLTGQEGITDGRTQAPLGGGDTGGDETAVSRGNGVPVDSKRDRQLPYGRQGCPRLQLLGLYQCPYRVEDLRSGLAVDIHSVLPASQQRLAHPRPRELPGTASVAVAAGLGPADRFLLQLLIPLPLQAQLLRHAGQPVADHIQVMVLGEGIEGHPQTEAVRQGDLLLDRLAGMQLTIHHAGTEVVAALL